MVEEVTVPRTPFFEILPEIQGVLGEENQKVFAQASMNLGRRWAKTIEAPKSVDELMEKIANHLRDEVQLAETVELEREDQEYLLKVRGCYICHGKLVKERFGFKPACPISMFPVGAVTEIFKVQSAKLKEIRKPGPPGECDLIYEIKI